MAPKSHQKAADESVEHVMQNGNEAMKNGMQTWTKAIERFSGLGKENVEAYMKATTAVTKAVERINGEVMSFSKQQVEDGVAAFKAVSGAKSVHQAWEVQTDFAKSALDAYVAQATKINDMWMAAAKQAMEPMTARFSALAEAVQEVRPASPFARAAE
ncbi:MAG: phasin family protein [Alphaproteobacteria bacterium]|nr:phasin family protein [Alphaproteobacteria bacterium]